MDLERLVLDYSELFDGCEVDVDNTCHVINIQTAYEGEIVWNCNSLIVYTPIFGENLEDTEGNRDITLWNDTKYILFILNNVSTHIYCPYIELLQPINLTSIRAAYCNLEPPRCDNFRGEQFTEVITLSYVNPYRNNTSCSIHITKPITQNANQKLKTLILLPDALMDGNDFRLSLPDLGYKSYADIFAALGYAVVTYPIIGRGLAPVFQQGTTNLLESSSENYNGAISQALFGIVLQSILGESFVDVDNIGVISFGFGNSMALGYINSYYELANASPEDNLNAYSGVKFILDIDGYYDRTDTASCDNNGALPDLTNIHDCHDDIWWMEREPRYLIDHLHVNYKRLQFENARPNFNRNLVRYIMALTGISPFVQFNNEPHNILYEEINSLPMYPLMDAGSKVTKIREALPNLFNLEKVILNIPSYIAGTNLIDTYDYVVGRDEYCYQYGPLRKVRLHNFIHAQKLRGWVDENGECPFPENQKYLCGGTGFDVSIVTLQESHRNRVYNSINCLLSDTGKQINTNVVSLHFDDEYQTINGQYRRLKKFNTEIRAWKPLKYSLRLSPPVESLTNFTLANEKQMLASVSSATGKITYTFFEMPTTQNEYIETFDMMLKYAPLTVAPTADLVMEWNPATSVDATAFPKLGIKFIFYKTNKLPICIYNNNMATYELAMDTVNTEYPVDTFGWATKLRFKMVFHTPNEDGSFKNPPKGIYTYTLNFKLRMPSMFAESAFGDYFKFTDFLNPYSFKIYVR